MNTQCFVAQQLHGHRFVLLIGPEVKAILAIRATGQKTFTTTQAQPTDMVTTETSLRLVRIH